MIGSWSAPLRASSRLAATRSPGAPLHAARLPGAHTSEELAIRSRYTVTAIQMETCGNDFRKIKAIVDAELAPVNEYP